MITSSILQFGVSIGMGPAVLVVGILAITAAVALMLNNPAAMALWGFTVLILIFVLLFDIGSELFWIGMLLTVVLLIIGVVARINRL